MSEPKLDMEFVRALFPPLKDGWVFVENAGGTYVPQQVLDRVQEYMRDTQVQPNWGFASSQLATDRIKHGKQLMAEFVNADPDEIVLGPSTTMNVFLLSQAMLVRGDQAIDFDQPCMKAVLAGLEMAIVKRMVYDALDDLLSDKTRLVAFTHCSNVCSIVHDVPALVKKIHEAGALSFIDGTAFAPHFPVDVKALDVDFYVCSLYKICGPHQSILYGKRELLLKAANLNHHFIANDNFGYKLLPGGVNHEFSAGSVGVADYFDALYDRHFKTRENSFHARLIKVYGLIAAHEHRLATSIAWRTG